MKTKLFLLCACALFAIALGASAAPALALPQPRGANVTSVTIPYSGRLTNETGQPVADGGYDFAFALYDAETGGTLLWTETQRGVTVKGGAIAASLGAVNPLRATALDGGMHWLAVSVRGPGESEYTLLTPWQQLSVGTPAPMGAPAAGPSCPHDHWGETWGGTGVGLSARSTGPGTGFTTIGLLGVGSASPIIHPLPLDGFYGVYGRGDSSGVYGVSETGSGVYGLTTTTGKAAVYGTGPGIGVYGEATGTGTGVSGSSSGSGSGVSGSSTSGNAVSGLVSNSAYAGHFLNFAGTGLYGGSWSGTDTSGVYGQNINTASNTNGVYGTGYSGVKGESSASNGNGVVGIADYGTDAYGVWGKSASGYAGYFFSNTGYGGYFHSQSGYAGWFTGKVHVSGLLEKSGGGFKIDHPLDPSNKYLNHSFVESPDMMNVYNGNITTDANGDAIVILPDYFEALNRDFRYQLTVIGQFAQAIVKDEIKNNRFTIKTDKPSVKVSWQVTGIRHDPFADQNRIQVEETKPSGERGMYIYPQGYGQPQTLGIGYAKPPQAK